MAKKKKVKQYQITTVLVWLGILFSFSEFFLHLFGLPILEHDKIHLFTHDGYIALFTLMVASFLYLSTTDFKKYKTVFYLTMGFIACAFVIGSYIAYNGGYSALYPVITLDEDIRLLGVAFLLWIPATLYAYYLKK